MRVIKFIVIHCSASDEPGQDSPQAIKDLHTSPISKLFNWGKYKTNGKGWSDIGYHFVITQDGLIHEGRPLEKIGAHVAGFNSGSIGICLTGDKVFSQAQFISLESLCSELCRKFGIEKKDILGHSELDKKKTCPNFNLHKLISGWKWF